MNFSILKRAQKPEPSQSASVIRLTQMVKAVQFSELTEAFGKVIELKLPQGLAYSVGLFKDDSVAIARTRASADAIVPLHVHDEWENLIVYKGELILTIDERDIILNETRRGYYIKPNAPHSAKFTVETEFIAITIPAAEEWPRG